MQNPRKNSKAHFSVSQLAIFVVITAGFLFLFVKIRAQSDLIEKLQMSPNRVTGLNPVENNHLRQSQLSILLRNQALTKSELPTMRKIGMKTQTDKVTHHGYDRYYPMFLESHRDTANYTMLEIGYLGGASYQMWLEYFPKGNVYFMDKDCAKDHPHARFCGDQGSVKDLQTMLQVKGIEKNLDFIIDDGSHHPQHQIVSFKYLFEHGLKPGGIYIIEDIEMNYWQKGDTYGHVTEYGRDHPLSFITYLKALVDVTNREFTSPVRPFSSPFGSYVDSWTGSIFFGHNCVVVTKMSETERDVYGTRRYRYTEHFLD